MNEVLWGFRIVLPILAAYLSAKVFLQGEKRNYYFLFLYLILPTIDAYLWLFSAKPIDVQGLYALGVQEQLMSWFVLTPDVSTFKNMFFIGILQAMPLLSVKSKVYPVFMMNLITLLVFSSQSIWVCVLLFALGGIFLLYYFLDLVKGSASIRVSEELWRLSLSVGFMVFLSSLSFRDGQFDHQTSFLLLFCSILYSFPWVTKKDNSAFLPDSAAEWWSVRQWHRWLIPLFFGTRISVDSRDFMGIWGIVGFGLLSMWVFFRAAWTESSERQFDYLSRASVPVLCLLIYTTKTENYILFGFSFFTVMMWLKLASEQEKSFKKTTENLSPGTVMLGFLLLWILSGFPGTVASTAVYEVFENKQNEQDWLGVFLFVYALFILLSLKVIWSYLGNAIYSFSKFSKLFWVLSGLLLLWSLSLTYTGVWSGGMLSGEKDRAFHSAYLWSQTLPFEAIWLKENYTFFIATIASFYLFLSLLSYFLWLPGSPVMKRIQKSNPFHRLGWFRLFRRTLSWSQVHQGFCWLQNVEDRYMLDGKKNSFLFSLSRKALSSVSKLVSLSDQALGRGWRVQKEWIFYGLERVSNSKSNASLVTYFMFSLLVLFSIIFWLLRGLV